MDLERYLSEKSELVNRTLERLLPEPEGYAKNLAGAMRYSVFAGGKRIRPAMVLASTEACGGKVEDAIMAACAFECIHTYSLIHDDLPAMDNDDIRRGKPTCHKAFGEAVAILAGDALLTLAFEAAADSPGVKMERLLKVVAELARAAGYAGMIGGQVMDMESEGVDVAFPVLESIHIHKTGALITSAVRCGAIIAGAKKGELEKLTGYGEAVGLSFQIADDILNVEGREEKLGKPVRSDKRREKAAYPALVGVVESKRLAEELLRKSLCAIEGFDEKAEPLRAIARFIVERRN
ncbi:MAG: polyprenyl synthetase family protein [Deltaproteobacteria bacterium]|nr:polyprenyl synthetase family protein [Deltaproteobacteria bacterium]